MEINFYGDTFLVLNFIMNLFLLSMTVIIRRKRFFRGRIFGVALLGGIFSVGLAWIMLYMESRNCLGISKFIMLPAALAEMILMVCLGLPEMYWKERVRNSFTFIKISLLTAGFLFLFREQMWGRLLSGDVTPRYGMGMVAAGTALLTLLLYLMKRQLGLSEGSEEHVLDGVLIQNGKEYGFRALYDTGNQLVSPYTGEPVIIISRSFLEQTGVTKTQNPVLIPYHSIGGKGLLETYRMEKLKLQNGEERTAFLAAASEEISMDTAVQIILNG